MKIINQRVNIVINRSGEEEHAQLINSYAYHNIKNTAVNMGWEVDAMNISEEEKETLHNHIKNIYDTLTEFRNLGEMSQRTSFETNELKDLLQKLLGNSLKQKGIKFEIENRENLLINQSLYHTFHVINNLVINASKALENMTGDKKIHILSAINVKTLVVKISDNGCGVAEKDKNRIFDPHFSTTNGSGLGLPSVKAKLAEMGGTISLTTPLEPYQTTFTINLPIK